MLMFIHGCSIDIDILMEGTPYFANKPVIFDLEIDFNESG